MVLGKETQLYRRDAKLGGTLLTPQEREELLKPYLPKPVKGSKSASKTRSVRGFLGNQIQMLFYAIIHTLFSLYVRFRQAYNAIYSRILTILYYHHRTPELIQKDVKGLSRLPQHLSVILELEEERGEAGVDGLLDDLAELSAWCASAGIPTLSVYEKTGILKNCIPATHRAVAAKLHSYFGPRRPSLQIRAPHVPSFLNGDISDQSVLSGTAGHLSILLLSSEDGRSTLVDLTKTLTEMAQREKLSADDISLDLVDAEISESVMGEPNLLLLFGPNVQLQGYPPWQLRLTEIFHVKDNVGVEYQVFLRALFNYAKVQMRFGR
ncbi:MAG: hypothetical protein MMC33_002322 [Icmadophila ericetorum]|nr:hypothetical protein [Icmadophila ericetorum]